MRLTLLTLSILLFLTPQDQGQAQDITRDLRRSHQIQRQVTGLSAPKAPSGIPASSTIETSVPQAIKPNTLTTTTTTLPSTSVLPSAATEQPMAPEFSIPSFEAPSASSNINPNLDPFKPKMRTSSYEAQYMASLRREAEEAKKKKTLMNSISEEITNYGLWFLLAIVIFLIIFALKKEPKRAGPQKLTTGSGEEEPKQDIWKSDDLIT